MPVLNLNLGVRPDETGHFYLQSVEPRPDWLGWRWLCRVTWWNTLWTNEGDHAYFYSVVLFWYIQVYWGTAKCDGSRTFMARKGELSHGVDPYIGKSCVMTDLPRELFAFRIRSGGMQAIPEWTNMGGC